MFLSTFPFKIYIFQVRVTHAGHTILEWMNYEIYVRQLRNKESKDVGTNDKTRRKMSETGRK